MSFGKSNFTTCRVVITGIGLISALGNLNSTWKNLIAGKSGVKNYQPFPELGAQILGLIGENPASLTNLITPLIKDTLADANLSPPLSNFGVVIGSSRSFQGEWEKLAKTQSDLINFTKFLPHLGALNIAQQINSIGPILAPMSACATGLWSIFQGYELIVMGKCQGVIAGALEAPITPLTLAGFRQMGALAKNGIYPFDRDREGMALGEGGALFILESWESAQRRQATIYGEILGFGFTNDACHLNAPAVNGKSALECVQKCLERSHLSPVDIDFIHAHGTGTQLNDRHEALLIKKMFSPQIPITSTKGATGHLLGASGALGLAFCLKTLQTQILPPNVGLINPEFDLNFVTNARHQGVEKILCLSFGFGGQNAAMVISSVPI